MFKLEVERFFTAITADTSFLKIRYQPLVSLFIYQIQYIVILFYLLLNGQHLSFKSLLTPKCFLN